MTLLASCTTSFVGKKVSSKSNDKKPNVRDSTGSRVDDGEVVLADCCTSARAMAGVGMILVNVMHVNMSRSNDNSRSGGMVVVPNNEKDDDDDADDEDDMPQ